MANSASGTDYLLIPNFCVPDVPAPFRMPGFPTACWLRAYVYVCVDVYVVVWIPSLLLCLRIIEVGRGMCLWTPCARASFLVFMWMTARF